MLLKLLARLQITWQNVLILILASIWYEVLKIPTRRIVQILGNTVFHCFLL